MVDCKAQSTDDGSELLIAQLIKEMADEASKESLLQEGITDDYIDKDIDEVVSGQILLGQQIRSDVFQVNYVS